MPPLSGSEQQQFDTNVIDCRFIQSTGPIDLIQFFVRRTKNGPRLTNHEKNVRMGIYSLYNLTISEQPEQ